MDESELKKFHISINMSEIKYEMDETKYEEPLVTDNLVINAPIYFKLLECGNNFLKNIDATYEQTCMATLQGKWNTEKLRYGQE